MNKVGFWTAVSFNNQSKSFSQSLLEKADGYFPHGGKKAFVVLGHAQLGLEGTVLAPSSSPPLLTALKILSYFTVLIPLFVLCTKALLRFTHEFHFIDVEQKLGEGLDLSVDAVAKIRELMAKFNKGQGDAEVTWYPSGHSRVFSIASIPNLIFKSGSKGRFANMVKAKEVCLVHNLGLLKIPRAKILEIEGQTLIAEERFKIAGDESAQEFRYQKLANLDQTIQQLATFIIKSGFSDVEWRNIPILDDAPAFQGPRQVGLVDLEALDSPTIGIFGCDTRRGLIHCLFSEEQIDSVLAEARRHGVVSQYAEQIKASRLEQIEQDRQLQAFYEKNRIRQNPRKPIQIGDLATLGLNLNEQGSLIIRKIREKAGPNERRVEETEQPITLRQATADVIGKINEAIKKASHSASVKGKRCILLDHNRGDLGQYANIGLGGHRMCANSEEERRQTWLFRIIDALVTKGHLFKLNRIDGHGWHVQA